MKKEYLYFKNKMSGSTPSKAFDQRESLLSSTRESGESLLSSTRASGESLPFSTRESGESTLSKEKESVEEKDIIGWIRNSPNRSVKDISQFFEIDKKIINKKLYSLLSRGILNVDKEINPPKWSVNEKVVKIAEEVPLLLKEKGKRATKDLASHFSVKKSELNKVLYSLQKLNILSVEKDDEGKNPMWGVVPLSSPLSQKEEE